MTLFLEMKIKQEKYFLSFYFILRQGETDGCKHKGNYYMDTSKIRVKAPQTIWTIPNAMIRFFGKSFKIWFLSGWNWFWGIVTTTGPWADILFSLKSANSESRIYLDNLGSHFCVEFKELSNVTRDLSQAKKKMNVIRDW